MTEYKQGDIALVDFEPSVGREYKKIRPALIVQSDKTLHKSPLITVMPITSSPKALRAADITIQKNSDNGLFADSIIKVACIHSFDRSRLQKKIGAASEKVMEKVLGYIQSHFGIF